MVGRKSLTALVAVVVGVPVMAATVGVGLPADAVTVPIEKVTVTESQVRAPSYADRRQAALHGKTESERLAAIAYVHDDETLVSVIRNDASAAVRKVAFSKLVDDDLIFRLIFKPGTAGVADVRPYAVEGVAEVEVAKWLVVANCCDAKAKQAASLRLSKTFAEENDRVADGVHPVIRAYIQRSADR